MAREFEAIGKCRVEFALGEGVVVGDVVDPGCGLRGVDQSKQRRHDV